MQSGSAVSSVGKRHSTVWHPCEVLKNDHLCGRSFMWFEN